jgi:aspartate racemase
MKTIGLVGGMSWESSLHYYRIVNEAVRDRLGGLHSAQCLLYSVDFQPIERMQVDGEWARAADVLGDAARRLERGGADFFLLCTNTMHKVADAVAAQVRIPLVHVADATAAAIRRAGLRRVGLLGTRFTMEEPFYRDALARRGVEALVPAPAERALVHRVIYDELCRGQVRAESRAEYERIIDGLRAAGAEGIVLGCTEIRMLIDPSTTPVPAFDTTTLHATAAVDLALASR